MLSDVGVRAEPPDHPTLVVLDRLDSCEERPKMAVPTRTSVAPSSTATSKSWLMPMDSAFSID